MVCIACSYLLLAILLRLVMEPEPKSVGILIEDDELEEKAWKALT